MITISMFGKWALEIPDEYTGNGAMSNELGSLSPFIRSIVLRPDLVAEDVYCYKRVVERCVGAKSAAEYFAGVGTMTMLIQEILHPVAHYVSDYSDDCVTFLQDVLCAQYPMLTVEKRDAFNMQLADILPYDFISLDFNISYGKLVNDPKYRALVGMVAKKGPRYLHMSDKAASYFHVNKSKYTKHFGFPVDSITDYIAGMSQYFSRNYGYHVILSLGTKTAAHILFEKGADSDGFDHEDVKDAPDVDIYPNEQV